MSPSAHKPPPRFTPWQLTVPAVRINNRAIGPGQRAYVIAEVGVNHNGEAAAALRMIEAAAVAGADAVKFQAFRADGLVTADAGTAGYQQGATGLASQREMLRRLELSGGDFAALQARCRACGVEFLATPFGSAELALLVDLGVAAVKIASTDLNNLPLLEAAAQSGLPLILSTGASCADEIERTVSALRGWGCGERLVLLHCVSSYPTAWEDANLRRIGALAAVHGVPVGYSDHTTSVQTGALAVAAGACAVEKHFTLDRRLPGPDQALSLEPGGLAEYIARIREAEAALGDGDLAPRAAEAEVRKVARKSVVAARAIRAGEIIEAGQLTTKRPAGGLAPERLGELIGRRARVDIAADGWVSWEMVE